MPAVIDMNWPSSRTDRRLDGERSQSVPPKPSVAQGEERRAPEVSLASLHFACVERESQILDIS